MSEKGGTENHTSSPSPAVANLMMSSLPIESEGTPSASSAPCITNGDPNSPARDALIKMGAVAQEIPLNIDTISAVQGPCGGVGPREPSDQ